MSRSATGKKGTKFGIQMTVHLDILVFFYKKKPTRRNFLNFILVKISTYFKQTYCPSSAVLLPYSQQLVFVILFMSASEVEISTSLADSQRK